MNRYDKAQAIMEGCRAGLIFPFHIEHSLRESDYFYNENYTEFHTHEFQSVVVRVYEDQRAFYLTEEDKKYYSKQELEVIEQIKDSYR